MAGQCQCLVEVRGVTVYTPERPTVRPCRRPAGSEAREGCDLIGSRLARGIERLGLRVLKRRIPSWAGSFLTFRCRLMSFSEPTAIEVRNHLVSLKGVAYAPSRGSGGSSALGLPHVRPTFSGGFREAH